MTFQQMKYLVATAEAGSISEAARRLYVSQSSISEAIKNLEEYFTIQIFNREGRGVFLTREGEELVIEANIVLQRLDAIHNSFTHRQQHSFGLSVVAQHHIFGIEAFAKVLKRHLQGTCNAEFYECATQEAISRVADRKSEVGVLFYTVESKKFFLQELKSHGLVFHRIAVRRSCAYLKNTHPLADRESVRMEELNAFPCITYERTALTSSVFTEPLLSVQTLSDMIHVNDRAAAFYFIDNLQAWVVGTGFQTDTDLRNGIVAKEIADGRDLEIGYIDRSNQTLTDRAQEFVDELSACVHDNRSE